MYLDTARLSIVCRPIVVQPSRKRLIPKGQRMRFCIKFGPSSRTVKSIVKRTLIHWRNKRPVLIRFYAKVSLRQNDAYHECSCTQSRVPEQVPTTPAQLQSALLKENSSDTSEYHESYYSNIRLVSHACGQRQAPRSSPLTWCSRILK